MSRILVDKRFRQSKPQREFLFTTDNEHPVGKRDHSIMSNKFMVTVLYFIVNIVLIA